MPEREATIADGERDKQVERERYDASAARALARGAPAGPQGIEALRPALRAPYVAYEAERRRRLRPGLRVLELGAGGGMHTGVLVATGASVVATDISERSLELLAKSVPGAAGNLATRIADMESLPFAGEEFDLVACAGSLSYGDPDRVADEVLRVLRPGGCFVCVDSLNDNPVYRLNRWAHHLRGERSSSTLRRMPSLRTIDGYRRRFARVEVAYFGAATFLVPLVAKAVGEAKAAGFVDAVDRLIRVKGSAFKFVMVAVKVE
jgi:SAM-dependent methyltransferase